MSIGCSTSVQSGKRSRGLGFAAEDRATSIKVSSKRLLSKPPADQPAVQPVLLLECAANYATAMQPAALAKTEEGVREMRRKEEDQALAPCSQLFRGGKLWKKVRPAPPPAVQPALQQPKEDGVAKNAIHLNLCDNLLGELRSKKEGPPLEKMQLKTTKCIP